MEKTTRRDGNQILKGILRTRIERMCSRLIWLRAVTNRELFMLINFRFCKVQGISCLVEQQLTSHKGLSLLIGFLAT